MRILIPLSMLLASALPMKADEFATIEKVAIEALDEWQEQSFRHHTEFCGWVLEQNGEIFAGEVKQGTLDSCELPDTPSGAVVRASFHTHGAYDPDYWSEVPSMDDVVGDFEEGVFGFVGTPGGRIWLNDPFQEEIFMICGEGCIRTDPNYVPEDIEIPEQFDENELAAFIDE